MTHSEEPASVLGHSQFKPIFLPLTGRGPPGDASVCHSDWSAVRTPGGPGPDQGGLSQCLCRAERYFGKAGARVLLGAPQLGADLNIPSFISQKSFSANLPNPALGFSWWADSLPLPKACWPARVSNGLPLPDWHRARPATINWGTKGRGWCQRNTSSSGVLQQIDSSVWSRPVNSPKITVLMSLKCLLHSHAIIIQV